MPPAGSGGGAAATASSSHAPQSRAKPQGSRRKANAASADDAAYHGVVGMKRGAGDRAEGEPRMKRKRVDASANHNAPSSSAARRAAERSNDVDGKLSLIDFHSLPTSVLFRYLAQYQLIPEVDPPPSSAADPPPPMLLLHPRGSQHSADSPPPPTLPPTPANRPRREASASASNRRRSSRLLEDDRRPHLTPVLADVGEVHNVLATIAERHFREHAVKEMDTLTTFMCAVKAKGKPSSL
ncbi:hypothetical protein K474DRAFT_1085867 [Panus rudis PR-1116 ss-1]|nr:hypothetical protein K474DRAFT_1085867 [Panus rudis PR-1116 ss-1]